MTHSSARKKKKNRFLFSFFSPSGISGGDTFSLGDATFLFYVNKSPGAAARQPLICQLWLLTSVTSGDCLLLSKLKNRVIWISLGENAIFGGREKSAAFPFFFCRDKTVFSGVPTELMRTKHFGANNSLRPPFFFLFHPYCGSLADNGNLYLLITDLLPVTTNGKCLLVIKHQVWMQIFTLTRMCVWCCFFCFF